MLYLTNSHQCSSQNTRLIILMQNTVNQLLLVYDKFLRALWEPFRSKYFMPWTSPQMLIANISRRKQLIHRKIKSPRVFTDFNYPLPMPLKHVIKVVWDTPYSSYRNKQKHKYNFINIFCPKMITYECNGLERLLWIC